MDIKDFESTDWFQSLVKEIGIELARLTDSRQDQGPALRHELKELQDHIDGWSLSLAKRDLDQTLRAAIEANWGTALRRQNEIEALLAEQINSDDVLQTILDPGEVIARLERLADVLAANNPTQGNLELSMFVDRVDCFNDGRVTVRTCKLGLFSGAVQMLARENPQPELEAGEQDPASSRRAKPRRRARLRTDGSVDQTEDQKAAAFMAADPDRFSGLGDEWFWIDEFKIPDRPKSWAAQNAERVFARRQQEQLSYASLAKEFGVTAPTARAAVLHYLATNPGAQDMVVLPRSNRREPDAETTK